MEKNRDKIMLYVRGCGEEQLKDQEYAKATENSQSFRVSHIILLRPRDFPPSHLPHPGNTIFLLNYSNNLQNDLYIL